MERSNEEEILSIEEQQLEEENKTFTPTAWEIRKEHQEAIKLVDWLLKERLGSLADLVGRYLGRSWIKKNTMKIPNLAAASLRFDVSPAAAAACGTGMLKDLMNAGYISPDMSYLTCDPNKVRLFGLH